MPTVAYIIDSLQTGGAEKSTIAIASQLPDFTPEFIYFKDQTDLLPLVTRLDIPVRRIAVDNIKWSVSAFRLLHRSLRANRPDLIVATLFWAEVYARLAGWALGIPVVGTFVNDSYSKHRYDSLSFIGRLKLMGYQVIDRVTSGLCRGFIANSAAIKISNCAALNVDPGRVIVIHRGRELSAWKTTHRTGAHSGPALRFINVSRLIARKNQSDIISAYATFRKLVTGSEFHLSLVGDGPDMQKLLAVAAAADCSEEITLAGNRNDIPTVLEQADVFVFSSSYEGFSGALVEAMLAGLIIICSDIPTNREVVVDDSMAYFYPLRDVVALARQMEHVARFREEASAKANKAQSHAFKHYDIKKIASQHDSAYHHFLTPVT